MNTTTVRRNPETAPGATGEGPILALPERGSAPHHCRSAVLHIAAGAMVAALWAGAAGCGNAIPLPVRATPTAADFGKSPLPEPPPPVVTTVEEMPGFCSHRDFGQTATFLRHYSASDGHHYHSWLPPAGPAYWVRC